MMLRVAKNLQQGSFRMIKQLKAQFSNVSSTQDLKQAEVIPKLEKSFEEKAAIFERFSNFYLGGDKLEEKAELFKKISAQGFSRDVVVDRFKSELQDIYGKNSDKILNKKFTYEIQGNKDGVATGEFELFPQSLQDQGKFDKPTKNSHLVDQLHDTTYISINGNDIHQKVVPPNSHFSLYIDEFIPDEYVSELKDNQVCVLGFPKSLDQEDVMTLLRADPLGAAASDIVIGDCILSLPAYAVLSFSTPQQALEFKQSFNAQNKIIAKRNIYAATFEDSRKEHSNNRTLLVSGFQETESINELINFLSSFGSVMNFEIVEEPCYEALPTTQQVLDYLKDHVKPGDNSIVYEIVDLSEGKDNFVEYPPYVPRPEFIRDAKKIKEVTEEIELEKKRQEDLAKRQLIPRIVLNVWDADSKAPEGYRLANQTEEQRKIFKNIQNKMRHEFKNKQYLFLTYACTQQAQIAFHSLNSTGTYQTTLKKSTEHYHCDTAHQTSVFKQIKKTLGDVKTQFNDQKITEIQENQLLQESHQEMKSRLLEEANSTQFSDQLSVLLEKEVIGKTQHGVEHQLHIKSDKLGREFSSNVEPSDVQQIVTQLQQRQRANINRIESLSKDEDKVLNLYRSKVVNADYNKLSHPYNPVTGALTEEILTNVQNQASNEYALKQKQFMQEEDLKANWIEDIKEIIEKKAEHAAPKKGPRIGGALRREKPTKVGPEDEVPEIKEPKEPEEADQYYAPLADKVLQKKKNKYSRFVGEMQRLYDGEYSEAMKNKIFKNADESSTDIDGQVFVSAELGEKIQRIVLSDEQYENLKYYLQIADILPNKRIRDLHEQAIESPEETLFMIKQLELPTKVFDRTDAADQNEIPLNNEEFAEHLNKYVAELGQEYVAQKDSRGDEKIVLYEREPNLVPLKALSIDENQLLRDCLAAYGLETEAIEKEVSYFISHGDYSPELLKMVGESDTSKENLPVDAESEIDTLIEATGLSKAELNSLLNLDFEKNGGLVAQQLQQQKDELAFNVKMATPTTQDLIKNNTKLRIKDKQGKYKNSAFKFF